MAKQHELDQLATTAQGELRQGAKVLAERVQREVLADSAHLTRPEMLALGRRNWHDPAFRAQLLTALGPEGFLRYAKALHTAPDQPKPGTAVVGDGATGGAAAGMGGRAA